MPNQLCLRFDDARGTTIAVRKEAAELVDNFVGVEANRLRVVADERAREDAGRPLGKVIALESKPEIGADFSDGNNRFDADTATFPFASETGTESVSVRHEKPGKEQRSSRAISTKDP
jgi:hypothetical protein